MGGNAPTMAGKVCLVTGGTSGIGRAAAGELARLGATVVIVGRDRGRCEQAAQELATGSGNGEVAFLVADVSSLSDVRRVAAEFLASYRRLDVLVNNAGALFERRQESIDGIEMTLALNHVGPFLLTHLLLERLRASAPARVVNVSSDSHESVKRFDFDDPQARTRRPRYGRSGAMSLLWTVLAPRVHPAYVQYAQTKLAKLLFTAELARRLRGSGVTANAVHPGFVATAFSSGNGAYGWFMRLWSRLLAKSPEEGAKTVVFLASSPEVAGVSGRYFVNQTEAAPSRVARDEADAARLWRMSEEWAGVAGTPGAAD